MQQQINEEKIQKKDYTIILLKNHLSYGEIQEKLKEKYGTGMSNRDLGMLRKEIKEKTLPKNLETYQNAFINFYESVLSLKSSIDDSEILDDINEYHDLYYETRKELIIKNLPKDLRNSKVVKSITESIDELKNGDFVYLEDFKKKISVK
ncbi:hypothetical protein DSAG12_02644 [Promethearchaeum syntrophicum]|uniref:Uncharacterized protein n=1 Tax=Promethearchaeum syntrophicum TaxID=2594042 RepID=A0A5B9DCA7_9ARCH|nr:hypothetical protein [Candidatus Prometheoarchaeum syntrophicum]QEE16814.1 hypothetical protein DSAG12_02644 [Candidatus Prometheoarchaeum syntrophicum]